MPRMKKPEEQEPGAPGWMTTFADLMSLLLTFFILLLSFSTLEERKVKEALSSLKGALGVMPRSNEPRDRPDIRPPSIMKPIRAQDVQVQARRLRESLRSRGLERQVEVGEMKKGILRIRIPSSVLFRSGSAQLLESSRPVLEGVSELLEMHLEGFNSDIQVEGHTDDIPISAGLQETFPSNWELSTARAMAVMRFLTQEQPLPEDHFSVAGYADNKPLYRPSDLEDNRRRNRRVEITAIPKTNVENIPDDPSIGPMPIVPQEPIPVDDLPEPL